MNGSLACQIAWDEEFDVVVVGSGAGGLSAATTAAVLGASALVVEKSTYFGGSSATSGGVVWVPANPDLARLGITDSTADAETYLLGILGNRARWDVVRSYLANAPAMVSFFERHTAFKLVARSTGPDYYSENEGALPAGRMMDPAVFDGRELGPLFDQLQPPLPTFLLLGGMMVGKADVDALVRSHRSVKAFRHAVMLVSRFALDKLRGYRRGTRLTLGNAIAGRLLKSAADSGVKLWNETRFEELIRSDGRVVGIRVRRGDRSVLIRARRGVVLATGGFPGNAAMMARHVPHMDHHFSMAPESNSGDGIDGAVAAGGRLDHINCANAFWTPVSVMRRADGSTLKCPHLIIDRSKPGLIAVNQQGRRFVNEASSYHDFIEAMHREQAETATIPAWLVCDAQFLWRYGMGLIRPGPGRRGPFLKSGYLVRGRTLADLAQRIDVPAANLVETVAAHNRYAASGIDEDFGKGSTGYNRYLGDPEHAPNPCLGPIAKGPFYAIAVYPGDIGTSLGLRTDPEARVLDGEDQPIAGLFACGNDMNNLMAGSYPSGGITLGPALTFGYVIGRALAEETALAEPRPNTPAAAQ